VYLKNKKRFFILMATHYIKDSNQANSPILSFSLGRQNLTNKPRSMVIDNNAANKAVPSGLFAFDNNRPISAKTTSSLSTVPNNFLLNMANNRKIIQYPKQESFGDPQNPNFMRGFLNNYVFFAPVSPISYSISDLAPNKVFYFYSETSTDWSDINNWWMDENFTQQATTLPSEDTDVINILSPATIPDSITVRYTNTNALPINFPVVEINETNPPSSTTIQPGSTISLSNNCIVFNDDTINNVQIPDRDFLYSVKQFENDDFIIYRIENKLLFDGYFTLSFSSNDISPENNPMVIRITYDEETEQTIYQDVTSGVSEGSISATTNSFSEFIVIKNTVPTINMQGQTVGGFDPCLVLSGCTSPNNYNDNNCGFNVDNWVSLNCPGNQTRGSLIGGGSCGCYEPSFVTVEMIVSTVLAIGTVKTAICALGSSKSKLIKEIADLGERYDMTQLDALSVNDELKVLKNSAIELVEIVFPVSSVPHLPSTGGWVNGIYYSYESAKTLLITLQNNIRTLTSRAITLREELQYLDDVILDTTQRLNLLISQRASFLATLMADVYLLSNYLNTISNPKECEQDEILDPLTCECLPNPCSVINYDSQVDENGDSQEDRFGIVATWTVTIPDEYSLPLEITFSGGVNDLLLINGGGSNPLPSGYGVPGYFAGSNFNKTYTATERSFTISLFNTINPGANLAIQICPELEIGPINTGL